MSIKVLVFGQLAEIVSHSEINLNSIRNTNELTAELLKLYPKLSSIKYVIAINKKIANQNTIINQDDLIALLPPFSGG